jgi:hypothetical protein
VNVTEAEKQFVGDQLVKAITQSVIMTYAVNAAVAKKEKQQNAENRTFILIKIQN